MLARRIQGTAQNAPKTVRWSLIPEAAIAAVDTCSCLHRVGMRTMREVMNMLLALENGLGMKLDGT